jgi:hypothetical protein
MAPKEKATPWDGFANDFDNKALALPLALKISIELAERVSKLLHVRLWLLLTSNIKR